MHPAIANRRNKVCQDMFIHLEDTIRAELKVLFDVVQSNETLNSLYGDGIKSAIASVETTDPATPEGQEIRKNVFEYVNQISTVCRAILEDR